MSKFNIYDEHLNTTRDLLTHKVGGISGVCFTPASSRWQYRLSHRGVELGRQEMICSVQWSSVKMRLIISESSDETWFLDCLFSLIIF